MTEIALSMKINVPRNFQFPAPDSHEIDAKLQRAYYIQRLKVQSTSNIEDGL